MTPEQEAHKERMVRRFETLFAAKYSAGQREHGGNMWEKSGMLAHAFEEVLDLWAYLCTLEEQLSRPRELTRPREDQTPVIYIAGPFRGANAYEIECNIRRAEALALRVWRLGCAAVCPHANTRFFQGAAEDAVWLKGDLAILARCDAVLMTPDWKLSEGATAERSYALSREMPVFDTLSGLEDWLDRKPRAALLTA